SYGRRKAMRASAPPVHLGQRPPSRPRSAPRRDVGTELLRRPPPAAHGDEELRGVLVALGLRARVFQARLLREALAFEEQQDVGLPRLVEAWIVPETYAATCTVMTESTAPVVVIVRTTGPRVTSAVTYDGACGARRQ